MSAQPTQLEDRLSPSVRDVSARLEAEGFESWLVGESHLRLLMGLKPEAFELATSAPPESSLDLFPKAVPTQLQHGIVTVPTGGTPVDLASFRHGPALRDDLAHRDFTVLAMAYRPATGTFFDPYDGHRDLEARELRCV